MNKNKKTLQRDKNPQYRKRPKAYTIKLTDIAMPANVVCDNCYHINTFSDKRVTITLSNDAPTTKPHIKYSFLDRNGNTDIDLFTHLETITAISNYANTHNMTMTQVHKLITDIKCHAHCIDCGHHYLSNIKISPKLAPYLTIREYNDYVGATTERVTPENFARFITQFDDFQHLKYYTPNGQLVFEIHGTPQAYIRANEYGLKPDEAFYIRICPQYFGDIRGLWVTCHLLPELKYVIEQLKTCIDIKTTPPGNVPKRYLQQFKNRHSRRY